MVHCLEAWRAEGRAAIQLPAFRRVPAKQEASHWASTGLGGADARRDAGPGLAADCRFAL